MNNKNTNGFETAARNIQAGLGCTPEQAVRLARLALVAIADTRGIDTRDYCKTFGIK